MRERSFITFLIVLLVVLPSAVVLATCGSESKPQNMKFDLSIRADKLDFDSETIRVNQGDTVIFNINADTSGSFHLHGYNLIEDFEPEVASRMEFVADATGTFVIKIHLFEEEGEGGEHSHEEEEPEITLGRLEVYPR